MGCIAMRYAPLSYYGGVTNQGFPGKWKYQEFG